MPQSLFQTIHSGNKYEVPVFGMGFLLWEVILGFKKILKGIHNYFQKVATANFALFLKRLFDSFNLSFLILILGASLRLMFPITEPQNQPHNYTNHATELSFY